ncbi:Hypothetical protein, putative [Bodo saltans]|uniref:Uncharacterized protein n=1 Tax=Bodo saltans TaxID=75058 RepID=A0A0S4J2S3_BODSA|nr:Hypothetical protein, putative [Bodo saltans]|eukprot:CUG84775.1 Hypothetical protein, putative [Bodo saltans]
MINSGAHPQHRPQLKVEVFEDHQRLRPCAPDGKRELALPHHRRFWDPLGQQLPGKAFFKQRRAPPQPNRRPWHMSSPTTDVEPPREATVARRHQQQSTQTPTQLRDLGTHTRSRTGKTRTAR